MSENKSKIRGKIYCLMLYPDDNDEHRRIIELLRNRYNCLGMCHDRDTWDNESIEEYKAKHNGECPYSVGETKKIHHHIIVKFENARYLNALAKELNCEPNLIQKVSSFKSMALYMTHRDYPQKAQYQNCEFYGPLTAEVMRVIDKPCEDIQIIEIAKMLKSLKHDISYTDFVITLSTNGYYSCWRRNERAIQRFYDEYRERYYRFEHNGYR